MHPGMQARQRTGRVENIHRYGWVKFHISKIIKEEDEI
jgi:hypothetical protein